METNKGTYLVEGFRLPIGKANGIYKHIIPEVFTGTLLSHFLKKKQTLKDTLDELILGCAVGTGGNMARFASLEGGLSEKIPAYTVDAQCASGLKAIILADNQIKAGANAILAGGMESNSLAPKRQYHANDQRFMTDESYFNQASFAPELFGDSSLLNAAEKVAHQFNISKIEMIEWAVNSNHKAEQAIEIELFNKYVLPFEGIYKDQTIKKNITFDRLVKSQTSQLIDFTNTAHLHDGACVHLLVSEKYCVENSLLPKFKITATATSAVAPAVAPLGILAATEKLLQKTGMVIDEIDLFEVNESFAVNAIAFARYFHVNASKINTFGGNLAFGHPFGASGAINLLHLMTALEHTNSQKGLVAIAAAGGLGMAILIEKVA